MACYLTNDNILFSNGAFGQHYANEYLFNDLVDQNELFIECIKYYENLEEIKGLRFKNKKAVVFGTYGWSGESKKNITEIMKESGFEIIDEGIKALWNPNDDAIEECVEFGSRIGLKN